MVVGFKFQGKSWHAHKLPQHPTVDVPTTSTGEYGGCSWAAAVPAIEVTRAALSFICDGSKEMDNIEADNETKTVNADLFECLYGTNLSMIRRAHHILICASSVVPPTGEGEQRPTPLRPCLLSSTGRARLAFPSISHLVQFASRRFSLVSLGEHEMRWSDTLTDDCSIPASDRGDLGKGSR